MISKNKTEAALLNEELNKLKESFKIVSEKLKLMNSKKYVIENKILLEQSEKYQSAILDEKELQKKLKFQNSYNETKIKDLKKTNKKLLSQIDDLNKQITSLKNSQQNFAKEKNLKMSLDESTMGIEKKSPLINGIPTYKILTKRESIFSKTLAASANEDKKNIDELKNKSEKIKDEQRHFEIPNSSNTIAIGIVTNSKNSFYHDSLEVIVVDLKGRILFNKDICNCSKNDRVANSKKLKSILSKKNQTIIGYNIESLLYHLFGEQVGVENEKNIIDIKKGYEYYLNKTNQNEKIIVCSRPIEIMKLINKDKSYPNEGNLFQTIACADIYIWICNTIRNYKEINHESTVGKYKDLVEKWKKNI